MPKKAKKAKKAKKPKKLKKTTLKRYNTKSISRDKKLKAKHPGRRVSKSGKKYTENRSNRSDKDRRRRL
jgi:hypothetical protein